MAEEKVEEVKVEAAEAKVETAEVKVEAKEEVKSDKKKAPFKKGGKRPAKRGARGGKFGGASAKKPAVFSDSLEDRFPALAAKLKKQIEDGIKQKIKDAQNDPKVAEASKKFAQK